jgi:hypothetical protein
MNAEYVMTRILLFSPLLRVCIFLYTRDRNLAYYTETYVIIAIKIASFIAIPAMSLRNCFYFV